MTYPGAHLGKVVRRLLRHKYNAWRSHHRGETPKSELHRGALTFWAQHEGHVWVGLLFAGVASAVPLAWHSWREAEIGAHQAAVGHSLTLRRLLHDTLYVTEKEHARWATLASQSQQGVGAHSRFVELQKACHERRESLRLRLAECDATVQCLRLLPLRQCVQMAWNVEVPFDVLNILDGAAYAIEWASYYLGLQLTAPTKPTTLPVPPAITADALDAISSSLETSSSHLLHEASASGFSLQTNRASQGDSARPTAAEGSAHGSVLLDERKVALLRDVSSHDAHADEAMDDGEADLYGNHLLSTTTWSPAAAAGRAPCTHVRWWSASSVSQLLADEFMRTCCKEPTEVLARDTAYVVVRESMRGYAEEAAGGAIVHSLEEWLHYLGEYLELFVDDVDVG